MAGRKPHLAAVPEGARAAKREPKNITEALDGSSRDVLGAMRRALAKKLDAGEVSSNAIASAYKELRELDRLIRVADSESDRSGGPGEDVDDSFDSAAI